MSEILSSIRWGRVIPAAIAAQALLIVLIYAISATTAWIGWPRADRMLLPAAYLTVPFLAGVWAARKASAHFTANGTFVGLLTALIFVPVLLVAPPPFPLSEAFDGLLKVIGGALGGGLVGHRTRRGIRRRARH